MTLGGFAIFGQAYHCVHRPRPPSRMKSAYPGQNGVTSLYMGSRGREFAVDGVLYGASLALLFAAEAALLGFANGIGYTFVDTQGRAWPNVILNGDYCPDESGPKWNDFGWYLAYTISLEGLS